MALRFCAVSKNPKRNISSKPVAFAKVVSSKNLFQLSKNSYSFANCFKTQKFLVTKPIAFFSSQKSSTADKINQLVKEKKYNEAEKLFLNERLSNPTTLTIDTYHAALKAAARRYIETDRPATVAKAVLPVTPLSSKRQGYEAAREAEKPFLDEHTFYTNTEENARQMHAEKQLFSLKSPNIDAILRIWQDMKVQKIEPTKATYEILLDAFSNEFEEPLMKELKTNFCSTADEKNTLDFTFTVISVAHGFQKSFEEEKYRSTSGVYQTQLFA